MATYYAPPPDFESVVKDLLRILAYQKQAKITLIIDAGREGYATEIYDRLPPASKDEIGSMK